jgi:hypothetical protein
MYTIHHHMVCNYRYLGLILGTRPHSVKLHAFYPRHKPILSPLFFFSHGFLQPTANGTVKTPKDLSVGYLQTVGT